MGHRNVRTEHSSLSEGRASAALPRVAAAVELMTTLAPSISSTMTIDRRGRRIVPALLGCLLHAAGAGASRRE